MTFKVESPYDRLSEIELRNKVLDFVRTDFVKGWERSVLDQYVNTIIPRSIFLRNAPANADLLDLGAGDGTLSILKNWPMVTRRDIKMHAVSLDVGAQFEHYHDYEIGDFETTLPGFNGMLFDTIVCAHFIEHIADPYRALRFFASRLKPGGAVYIEWPHSISKMMPSVSALHDIGVDVMTSNFYDDLTHREAWPMEDIAAGVVSTGLQISAVGRVWYDYVANELMAHGKESIDSVALTYAVWYKFAWAHYIVASKPLA